MSADVRADVAADTGWSRLPDFLCIGALKAGTSYLDVMLRSHPELSLPLHLKEVEYFNRHHARGPEWYARQFAPADGRPRGEVSPQYLFDPACPDRIAAANPAARLIVSVRHPVERAVSQYRHWVQVTGYRGDFATFLHEHPGAWERSRYWAGLTPYRDRFPDDQLQVVVFEELVGDPLPVLAEIYAFLGVDPSHVPAGTGDAVNASGAARFPRLYQGGKRASRWLYEHGQGRVVERLKTVASHTIARNGRAADDPTAGPAPELAARLAADVRGDVDALSTHLGRDLAMIWQL